MTVALFAVIAFALLHQAGKPAAARSTAPLKPRSQTSVLVLNGNGTAGAASDMSTRLLTHGYRSAFATDAKVMTYARSLVLFRRGWAAEARRLAKDARIRTVAPLDGPIPAADAQYPLVAIIGH
jgi:hypothetical protein